jgi:hypothetical protein
MMVANAQAKQEFHLSIPEIKFHVFLDGLPYGLKHILCMPITNCMSACFDQLGKFYFGKSFKGKL